MIRFQLSHWPFLQWKREEASSQAIGWMALSVMIISASTYNAFGKVLTDTLSPITLAFLSEGLTGFFVLLSFGAVPELKRFLHLEKRSIAPLLSIGFLSGVLGPLLMFLGLHRTSATNAALFGNAEMLFLALFAVLFLQEAFNRVHLLSMFTIIAGILVIGLRGFSDGLTFQNGDMLVVISCICFAGGGIIFRKYLHHIDPNVVILTRSCTAIVTFFLLSPFVSHPLIAELRAFPIGALPVLLGFAFVSRFLNLFSFYESLERLPVTTVSLAMNVPVIGSILFSSWFLAEQLEGYHLIGGVFIIAGAMMLELAGLHPTEKHLENHLRQGT